MKFLVLSLVLVMSQAALAAPADLQKVLKENQDLFNAFFQDDQKSVEKEAKELASQLKASKEAGLKSVKDKVTALEKISAKNKKEKNLDHYADFIPPLVAMVNPKNTPDYAVFFCPMVEKKWIQNVKVNPDVKNVFAQDMISCGGKE